MFFSEHKVPHPYSGADESAPSLTGVRDDAVSKVPCQSLAFDETRSNNSQSLRGTDCFLIYTLGHWKFRPSAC
jgi:hypothetical protein